MADRQQQVHILLRLTGHLQQIAEQRYRVGVLLGYQEAHAQQVIGLIAEPFISGLLQYIDSFAGLVVPKQLLSHVQKRVDIGIFDAFGALPRGFDKQVLQILVLL